MEKQLKDYLYLYLGCECELTRDNYTLPHSVPISPTLLSEYLTTYALVGGLSIKPILRPLSDMTEEEKTTVKISKGTPSEAGWGISNTECWSFAQVRQLLLWHFDLFGLIEAGLALDKTKMEETKIINLSQASTNENF